MTSPLAKKERYAEKKNSVQPGVPSFLVKDNEIVSNRIE
jgi:hypothetical protein